METTPRITIKSVADRWKAQYRRPDGWARTFTGSSKEIHDNILMSKTLDQVDKAIGNSSWTTNSCGECGVLSRNTMMSFDINGGEYGHNICRTCLAKALKELR